MGYTHYFEQKKIVNDQQWEAFEKDAKISLDYIHNKLNIVLMSNDDNGIIINNERVNLNGDDTCDLDYETFYIEKDYPDFNFCKTERRPYDIAVCSLLLLANHHMPDHYAIGSDGNFEDWKDAMELNANLFQYAYCLPRKIDYSSKVDDFEELLKLNIEKNKLMTTLNDELHVTSIKIEQTKI